MEDIFILINNKSTPVEWKINGFSIGDKFSSISNDNKLYNDSPFIKSIFGALYYKNDKENTVDGIYIRLDCDYDILIDAVKVAYGEPYFTHTIMNRKVLYYPDLCFSISFKLDTSNKINLGIGRSKENLRIFNSNDVVRRYLRLRDLISMLENKKLNKLESLEIKAFRSILQAFMGSDNITDFTSGKFIRGKSIKDIEHITRKIGSIELYQNPKATKPLVLDNPSSIDLHLYWNMLFSYYIHGVDFINRTGRMNFTYWKTNLLNEFKLVEQGGVVREKMNLLENHLAAIIDPEGLSYDLKVMIENYDYPPDDIHWLKANDY